MEVERVAEKKRAFLEIKATLLQEKQIKPELQASVE